MALGCATNSCINHDKMENRPGFFRFPNDDPGFREKGTNAASPRTKVVVEAFVEVISSQGRLDSKIDNS